MQNIRNFSIIAHIDHGKSTIADRFIQYCGGLSDREMSSQVLDSMDIEKERGITIKSQSVSLKYNAKNGQTYLLNFIDTPGHVDFSYEVSRSLSACEGALLIVDASQGVEAQTVANCYTALDQGLEVLAVLNKIDLPAAEPERVVDEIEDVVGVEAHDAVHASAKSGVGIEEILEQIVDKIPAPKGDSKASIKALIIDSWFDNYLGVVSLIRVIDGEIKAKTNGSVTLFGNDLSKGFENMTQDDLALPFVRILGQLSPQVTQGDAKYIEDAKPGMIYNTVTNDLFDGKKGIKVIPCYYKKDYPEWNDRGEGPGAPAAVHLPQSPVIATGKREGSKIRLPNGNYLEETASYYVLVETKTGAYTPALITMKSTQLNVSKKWNSMMKTIQIPDGKGGFAIPPMHGVVYNLTSTLQKNDKGSWFGWVVTKDRILEQKDKSLYLSAKDFQGNVSKGNVQTKADVEEKSSTATPY